MPLRPHPLALLAALAAAACSVSTTTVTQAPVEAEPPAAHPAPALVAAPVTEEEAAADIAKNAVLVPALDAAFFRDDRRRPPRALALVVTEIQQLELLFQATAAAAADRPILLRRLAEDYVELERAASATAAAPASQGGRTPQSARMTEDRARKLAIRYYMMLLAEYSGYPQLDEATYYLALEHERAGDGANARRVYLQLIQRSPSSRFIPRAYLAFGELFFGEAMSDASKWELAGAAYVKVLTAPPPANEVYGYAWYRLAYVVANQGDRARALEDFKRAADWANAFPQLPGAATLGAEAQLQMKSFAGPGGP